MKHFGIGPEMEDRFAAAWTVVQKTAVLRGMASKAPLRNALVYGWARTVGALDPTTAECIVIVESAQ